MGKVQACQNPRPRIGSRGVQTQKGEICITCHVLGGLTWRTVCQKIESYGT